MNTFISSSNNSSTNIKVNNQKSNVLGNISVPLSSCPDVAVSAPSNAQQLTYNSTLSQWTNTTPSTLTTALRALTDCSISDPVANNALIYDNNSSKWRNEQMDHTTLLNIGTNTHAEIDSFISSAGAIGGIALLDSSGVLKSTEIPSSVIKSINSKNNK